MSCIGILLAIAVVIYLGTVIGLYSLCVENPRLYKAKKYVLYVPSFTLLCVLYGLLCGDQHYRRTVVKFLKIPHKSIIMLGFFAEVVATEKERRPRKALKKKAIFSGVVDLFKGIPHRNISIYYNYF